MSECDSVTLASLTVYYDVNGGEGVFSSQFVEGSFSSGASVEVYDHIPEREGYSFLYWDVVAISWSDPNTEMPSTVLPGDTISVVFNSNSVTLVAHWAADEVELVFESNPIEDGVVSYA